MKIAVVADTHRRAVEVIALLGMVGKAEPLSAAHDPLLGSRFTAVIVVAHPVTLRERDVDWWEDLQIRNSGPMFTLDEWSTP